MNTFEVKFFCPRWGSEHLPWDEFCQKVSQAGYDGIESGVPFEQAAKDEIKNALKKYSLQFIGQYYQSFEDRFDDHLVAYKKWLHNIATLNPVLIDSQTGKDYFSEKESAMLFSAALQFSESTGIPVAHETHRNKILFASHIAKKILEANPAINITADFSHWCCVAESLLEDQQEAVSLACDRAMHIHARIGYAQGPQINDPRAPEWKNEIDAHLKWWDSIILNRKKHGANLITITPEFGPAPYLQALPYSCKPVANQWDLNLFMMKMLKERYS